MSKIVKNISDNELALVGIGVVKAGETVTVPDNFNNPNFEVVKNGESKKNASKAKPSDDKAVDSK